MAAQRPVFARSVLAQAGVDQAGSPACGGGGGGGGGATARVKGSAISACERSGLEFPRVNRRDNRCESGVCWGLGVGSLSDFNRPPPPVPPMSSAASLS
jgi:hypothetical protein